MTAERPFSRRPLRTREPVYGAQGLTTFHTLSAAHEAGVFHTGPPDPEDLHTSELKCLM